MFGSVATFGYSQKDTEQELQNAMIANKYALIVDTRLSPVCGWSTLWTHSGLATRYGKRYLWRGDWLGNVNHHKDGMPIQLADEAQGIAWIVRGLEKGYTLLLLCGCSDYNLCHRKVIDNKVKQVVQDQLPNYSPGQRVLTPYGPGYIDPHIPLNIHRARNRYAVVLDLYNPRRYFFPDELQPYDIVQQSLIA